MEYEQVEQHISEKDPQINSFKVFGLR